MGHGFPFHPVHVECAHLSRARAIPSILERLTPIYAMTAAPASSIAQQLGACAALQRTEVLRHTRQRHYARCRASCLHLRWASDLENNVI